ncbi:hypothetical protein [Pseudothermotoga thermarum]|uniref:Uncharacterized protein n=1 Tax=Pseudothermotoga thermarum DSM 5069 TaxID=688269 RepID=F7YYM4_9THEM|nr:hypothetical protein [Pseudothermotoga thermarum]AEH51056.1 hypothetical protein Theth_0973 [Pseudothermotoga thermarum DSM 5069]
MEELNESDRKKIEKKVKEGYELLEILVKEKGDRYAIMHKNENYIAIKLSKQKKNK